jgi:succinate dehydrogenase / fumarate reductase cytochrome b subunit
MKLSDPAYDTLKRLHSLSGVIPIGAFLLEHLFTNSHAVQGAAAFDSAAAFLAGLPYVVLLEALGIWLPILFHAALGIVIATSSQSNLGRQRYAANWRYTLQRTTGLFLVLFIAYHMWSTRFSAEAMRAPSLYAYMRVHLSHPGIFVFYALGLLAACWHFGNGLFGFAIHWGLATSRSAQRSVARLGFAVFLVLALVGLNGLLGFLGYGVDLFQRPPAPAATVTTSVESGR